MDKAIRYFQTLLENKDNFIVSTKLAIIIGIRKAWEWCAPKSPQELDLVAGLILETTKILKDAWGAIFKVNKIDFSILSVYCHQTPQVTYTGASKNPELGDILFVHVHKDIRGNTYNNSLLYQVKRTSQQPYNIPNSEKHQLNLYLTWPKFRYIRSGSLLNGQKRNVIPKTTHPGAQYLLIDNCPPNKPESGLLGFTSTYPIGSCMASSVLYSHNPLELELFDFLLFKSGRAIKNKDEALKGNGWSRVIWDLIEAGIRKTFTRRRSDIIQHSRISTLNKMDGVYLSYTTSLECISTIRDTIGDLLAESLFNSDGNDDNIPPTHHERIDSEGSGVSLILIETWDRNE